MLADIHPSSGIRTHGTSVRLGRDIHVSDLAGTNMDPVLSKHINCLVKKVIVVTTIYSYFKYNSSSVRITVNIPEISPPLLLPPDIISK
jgi:hypothetical protein